MQRYFLLLLPLVCFSYAAGDECQDSNAECATWATHGECLSNPRFMLASCAKSCNVCGKDEAAILALSAEYEAQAARAPRQQAPPKEDWELENLEVMKEDSAVVDVNGEELAHLAEKVHGRGGIVVTWFYAPWCKQCKLARPGFEAAAKAERQSLRLKNLNGAEVVFARLDCAADPAAKKLYNVNSYPSFKVLRGQRHRWIEVPRNRSESILTSKFELEAIGPVAWVGSEEELRAALFEQVPAGANEMDSIGQGEALAVALLSSKDSPLAQKYADLASGCTARSNPMRFVATTDATLLGKLGLPDVAPDSLAVVKLFSEPDGAPASEQAVPRLVSKPLAGLLGEMGPAEEAAACNWALASRLPVLIDFDENPIWGKRAANLNFIKMHALLFLSPPHTALAGVVRAAATQFETGQVTVMQFMLSDFVTGQNAMFKRYGVNSVLDTPRLVFLDQRIVADGKEAPNRQKVYKGALTEEAIAEFLRAEGLQSAQGAGDQAKDEL